jgi:GNAT superfamily N-acetyltransferase
MFDLPPTSRAVRSWQVSLPLEERPWHIGLFVGPSGSGKSTIARALFSNAATDGAGPWPEHSAILDGFPATMSIKSITRHLCAVGLSSPPSWLKPFHVLSTGERFRAELARLLAYSPALAVMDEYSSSVDRTAAQIASAALAKVVRATDRKFIAVTCHEDVEAWLDPDWIYRPDMDSFTWRRLRRRPAIALQVRRIGLEAWPLFRPHHYLSAKISRSAEAFAAWWRGKPVAFSAWVNNLVKGGGKREHRTVVLPDYQGIGIGSALTDFAASLWAGLGRRVLSTTAHPAFVASRLCSSRWRLIRPPSLVGRSNRTERPIQTATTRLTAGFEYIGPAMEHGRAKALLSWSEA